ncbi:phosphatidylinositol kinase [Candidatus Magnetomorum sp. HK-1]|nr:phosphatidylinositol kinase [Candidatus Magnetomorum sp. HK-1]
MREKKITVFIYLPGETVAVPAGIFTHEEDIGIGFFNYGRKYIERKNALPLDPIALPLGLQMNEVTTNRGLYGTFRDSAPDYWGRLVIAAEQKLAPEALSEIDFLLNANATRVGNLDFRKTPDDPEPLLEPPHFNQMEQILEAAFKIEQGEDVSQNLLRLLHQGTSLGGARPKSTVQWKNALWIAKFSAHNDTLNIPRIEYATMTLAKICGIRIPELCVESIGKKDILLVRRFDRERFGNSWLRSGFLSSLSLMQWDEADRLSWSYGKIADTMRRYVSVQDLHELFRRMVFNILVRNTDDHPRNHGFIFDNKVFKLSPAYDIVPGLTQPGLGTTFFLAMSVGEYGREATLKNALTQAFRFGLSKKNATDMIKKLVNTVLEWRQVYIAAGCTDFEIQSLEPSFAMCKELDIP